MIPDVTIEKEVFKNTIESSNNVTLEKTVFKNTINGEIENNFNITRINNKIQDGVSNNFNIETIKNVIGRQGAPGPPGTGIISVPTVGDLPSPGTVFPPNDKYIVETGDNKGLWHITATAQVYLGPLFTEFTQGVAALTWTVTHNLGYRPTAILVEDTLGNTICGAIEHIDNNSFDIDFNSLVSGTVFYR